MMKLFIALLFLVSCGGGETSEAPPPNVPVGKSEDVVSEEASFVGKVFLNSFDQDMGLIRRLYHNNAAIMVKVNGEWRSGGAARGTRTGNGTCPGIEPGAAAPATS